MVAEQCNFRSFGKTLNPQIFASFVCGEISPMAKSWTTTARHPNAADCPGSRQGKPRG